MFMSTTCLAVSNSFDSLNQISEYLIERISPCRWLNIEYWVNNSFIHIDIATAIDKAHCGTVVVEKLPVLIARTGLMDERKSFCEKPARGGEFWE
jgi:hypothetical protein